MVANRPRALASSNQSRRMTRREMVRGLITMVSSGIYTTKAHSVVERSQEPKATNVGPYDTAILPPGVGSRFINNGNGLTMHVLEAGVRANGRPCALLL